MSSQPAPAPSVPPVALVTGAGKRLGREIALTLARAGWQVAVHYRQSRTDAEQTATECRRLGGRSALLCADLSDEDQARGLVPQAIAQLGRLDAVVNSASRFEHDNSSSFSFSALQDHMRSNVAAPVLLAQALQEHVVTRQDADPPAADACVVNLLDQKLWNQNPDFFSYTLSKAALEAANTMLALALAPHVRVVGVAPGLTLTSHLLDEARFQALHTLSPTGRASTPQDVASAVRFALENRSITGTTLLVDGGQHLMKFERDFSLM